VLGVNKFIYHLVTQLLSALPVISLAFFLLVYSNSSSGEVQPASDSPVSSKDEAIKTVPYITLRNKTGSDNAAEFYGGERSTMSAWYSCCSSN